MSKEIEAFGLVKRACELYIESISHLLGTDIIGNTINEALDVIEQNLNKAQAQKLNSGGRLLNKDLLYLSQCLKQCNELPLLYVNRTYGNKYVVPQKQFDDLTNENAELKKKARAFEIIKEKNVDIALVKAVDSVEQYNKIYVYDHILDVKWCLTKEEFDLLKEVVLE